MSIEAHVLLTGRRASPPGDRPMGLRGIMWKLPTILVAAWVILASVPAAPPALAGETKVAVAASFTEAAREIASAFAAATGHQALLSFGATGQLHAQIAQGAPFEVFLAADDDRPALAVADGLAVEGPYSLCDRPARALLRRSGQGWRACLEARICQLAIANLQPRLTGRRRSRRCGRWACSGPAAEDRAGQSIAQAFQFVESGNAELGFVALGQVLRKRSARTGSCRRNCTGRSDRMRCS